MTASRFCQETAAMSKCRCAEMGRNSFGGVRLMPLRAEVPMNPAEADTRIRGFQEINAAFISLNSVKLFHWHVFTEINICFNIIDYLVLGSAVVTGVSKAHQ